MWGTGVCVVKARHGRRVRRRRDPVAAQRTASREEGAVAMGASTERVRLAYGRGRQRATGGSYFAAVTAVATAKRSKADSAAGV